MRLTAAALGVLVVLLSSACQDWPQYMGNAGLTGNASGETTIAVSNVGSLTQAFEVPVSTSGPQVSTPSVSGSTMFAASSDGTLVAASTSDAGCSGTPAVCMPLWTAYLGHYDLMSQPVVAGGIVFEKGELRTGATKPVLAAFDAAGVTNCSGTPKVCQPLWTAPVDSPWGLNVADGKVFINNVATNRLEVFDAAGVTNCSGTPKVCQPIWTAVATSSFGVPAVAGNKVYVAEGVPSRVEVFDEAAVTNCSGSPTTCLPLFTVPLPANSTNSVDVSGGIGYINAGIGTGTPVYLVAFDATGTVGCTGAPLVCQPIWTASMPGMHDFSATPAVAGGRVFDDLTPISDSGPGTLYGYDATGATKCSGSPVVCQPVFTATTNSSGWQSPTIANGVVFAGGQAFDAAATVNCSGSAPVTCAPLWTGPASTYSSAAISNGKVYLGGDDGLIHVYQLP